MKSSFITLSLTCLFFLLSAMTCGDDTYSNTFYVRNSSADTIVVLCEKNNKDDLFYKPLSGIHIAPGEEGNIGIRINFADEMADLIQIGIFSIDTFHANGNRYEEMADNYPYLGIYSFSPLSLDLLEVGTTFYFPPRSEPVHSEWKNPWEDWQRRVWKDDSIAIGYSPITYRLPFYRGVMK